MFSWIGRPDIPFSREDANRYLPWVIAVMVCLVGLLTLAGISLHQASEQSGRLNIQSFQVYIPHHIADEALIAEASRLLSQQDQVHRIEPVSSRTLEGLIAPWTGGALELDNLPLPVVLEVTLQGGAAREASIEAIRTALHGLHEDIDVESYQDWVNQLTQFTRMLRLGVFLLVGLLCVALMAMVYIVVRTSLRLHFPAVRLLHNVGASDDYIIRQFVMNGCLMVLKGSLMGVGVASLLALAVSYLSLQLASPLLPPVSVSATHVVTLIGLPVALVLMTALLVRIAIMHMLEQLN